MGVAEACHRHAQDCEVLAKNANPHHRARFIMSAQLWRALAELMTRNEAITARRMAELNTSCSLKTAVRRSEIS
jgi:hypothetical protein